MDLFGGIEAGGTKFVCVIASGPDDVRAEKRIATTTPKETLDNVIAFFKEYTQSTHEAIQALGVACFGPLDLNPKSPTYGYITTTPKPGWANVDVVGPLKAALGLPVAFDTDVNGAAIGEGAWGAAQGMDDFLYFTIGTGIGGGAVYNGSTIRGLVHPEMGHVLLPHDRQRDPYPGFCPFHKDCFEGLASGPSMQDRWGKPATELPPDHPAWALEAEYIAAAMQIFVSGLSPTRVILGGGVMQQEQLFPLVRRRTQEMLNGYIQSPVILERIDDLIVPPGLGNRAGVLGAVALAQRAVK
ncbi:MAG: ROK family protein [Chloroflexi bacterium]|nr:ROK family protein [Anaerolineaceae bacterium]NMB87131.1 ROK family protein [Chloroflexota bacterium]